MVSHKFKPVSAQVNFPEIEEGVLKYWKEKRTFEKTIESKPLDKTWTFLDGPPFITGLPHYGSLLSSIPKDLFPRYWTMKGYRVRRVWGWDCHGLPAENKVEEKLGIKRKKDIEEKVGVKKFIDECKLYVKNVSDEWEWYVDHVGRWVDFQNAYKTMDLSYMESVMWVFKQMYEKGFIYKGLRVSLYCPHCATPISNFEVAMDADNYKDIEEPTATYKYKLEGVAKTYLLAWSTTPWNKIATPALAVNPQLTYVKVAQNGENYILAKATLKMLHGKYKLVEEFPGSDLIGKKFTPHYNFYKIDPGKKAFIVVGGDFVTAEEGTGIVTIAAYGEEDLVVMLRDQIQIVLHVDEEGMLKPEVPKWAGMYYLKVNELVIKDLQARDLIYKVDNYTHSVPTCWRCHTRLYYGPQDAWYVDVQRLKTKMKHTNEQVNWVPAHFKYGRYLKSLESAPDWCISRSRYWGSPVPVWECECGQRFVPGSIAELEAAAGRKISDLHKPMIDEIKVKCVQCGKSAQRVPEVLDSWIEAGSASLAERHFPFAFLKDQGILTPAAPSGGQVQDDPALSLELDRFFPPDFIVEYTGQIRAWFYVLHVISTALFDTHAFKNVVVTGVILGTDGRKMSKNYGNYPDPKEMLSKFGGDALRLYLMGSPVMRGEDIRISETEYRDQVRGLMLILWNVYNFFISYALVDRWQALPDPNRKPSAHVLDKWILSKLNRLVLETTEFLEMYDTTTAVSQLQYFVTDLSQWYLRRSRERVGPTAADIVDKERCYETLYEVLVTLCQLLAPFIPFVTEEIYRNLTGTASVHLSMWPKSKSQLVNEPLETAMSISREVASQILTFRKEANIKVRIPLLKLSYCGPQPLADEILPVVLNEVNVQLLEFTGKADKYLISGSREIGNQDLKAGATRELIRKIQQLRKVGGCKIDERISLTAPKIYQTGLTPSMWEEVKRKTLVKDIVWGDELSILTG